MSETELTRDSGADGEECRTTSTESSNQDTAHGLQIVTSPLLT